MYELIMHIEYLLLRHDCVIMPGIGAFISTYHPAFWDKDQGIFQPMKRDITFNGAINNDDGLLASSIARRSSIPFAEARTVLDRALSEIMNTLNSGEPVAIGSIGILKIGSDSQLEFTRMISADTRAIQMGFSPVKSAGMYSDSKISDPAVEIPVSTKSESSYNRPLDNRYYYIRIPKIAAKIFVTIIVILSLAGLSMLMPETAVQKQDMASVVPVDKIMDTISEKLNGNPADTALSIGSSSDYEIDSTTGNDSALDIADETMTYHLIIGTFGNREDAERFAREKYEETSIRTIVLSGKTLYRVSIKQADNAGELYQQLSSAEIRTNFPDAWVYKQP